MKKRTLLYVGIGLLILGVGIVIFSLKFNPSRKMTFEACTLAGGEAWRVDPYDPEICPVCVEYLACEEQNKGVADIREVCPQVMACAEWMDDNFPYSDTCPNGKQKIGEISDAAIWLQCCK